MTESNSSKTTEALDADEKQKQADKDDEKSLCRHGFHDWILKEGETSDEAGNPVVVWKCSRCGKEKVEPIEKRTG